MKHSSELIVRADPNKVAEVLADLSTYPSWNDLVSEAEPVEPDDGDAGPAWRTTLRAQVGPFARSKQLRFVREFNETHEDHSSVRFIRREVDGRTHAAWTMEAEVEPVASISSVTLSLAYDGGLWIPALNNVLHSAIAKATDRLPAYVEQRIAES